MKKDIMTTVTAESALAYYLHLPFQDKGSETAEQPREIMVGGHELSLHLLNPLTDGSFHDFTNFGQPCFGLGFETENECALGVGSADKAPTVAELNACAVHVDDVVTDRKSVV